MPRTDVLLALLVALSGCAGGGSSDDGPAADAPVDAAHDAGDGRDGARDADADAPLDDAGDRDTPAGCEPTIGSGSHFAAVDEFLGYVDEQRRNYGGEGGYGRHDRYKGIPWAGEYHTTTTFPNVFDRDDGLAERAQAEACRVAGGGAVQGVEIPGASPGQRPFWIHGINTADWMISVREHPGDWDDISPPFVTDKRFGLHHSNGSSRLGLHYHDFGGDGPAINFVGAGASSLPDGSTWWVLQFDP
jgi:hypothetical protein